MISKTVLSMKELTTFMTHLPNMYLLTQTIIE